MNVIEVAAVCHEANRMLCLALGDTSQPDWFTAPDWQRSSAIDGVRFHLAHPEAQASASHENWFAEKARNGWIYGVVKDPKATPPTHPCMVAFDELPIEQQRKDHLFRAIVHALAPITSKEEPA